MTPIALDIAIGFIILLSTLIAYFRGIVKEFFMLAGLGVAGFTAYKSGHLLIPGLNKWLGVPLEGADKKAEPIFGILTPEMMAKVAAYGGTFLLTFIVITLIGFMITRMIKEMGLGIVDRLLGAGFGFLRGFLLVLLLYTPFTYLIDQKKIPDWAKNSYSVPILQKTVAWGNERFELDKKIEERGEGVVIKFNKIDMDKIGEATDKAAEELKEAVKKEEAEVQKGGPEEMQQDAPLNRTEFSPAPPPAPAPMPAPAPAPMQDMTPSGSVQPAPYAPDPYAPPPQYTPPAPESMPAQPAPAQNPPTQ